MSSTIGADLNSLIASRSGAHSPAKTSDGHSKISRGENLQEKQEKDERSRDFGALLERSMSRRARLTMHADQRTTSHHREVAREFESEETVEDTSKLGFDRTKSAPVGASDEDPQGKDKLAVAAATAVSVATSPSGIADDSSVRVDDLTQADPLIGSAVQAQTDGADITAVDGDTSTVVSRMAEATADIQEMLTGRSDVVSPEPLGNPAEAEGGETAKVLDTGAGEAAPVIESLSDRTVPAVASSPARESSAGSIESPPSAGDPEGSAQFIGLSDAGTVFASLEATDDSALAPEETGTENQALHLNGPNETLSNGAVSNEAVASIATPSGKANVLPSGIGAVPTPEDASRLFDIDRLISDIRPRFRSNDEVRTLSLELHPAELGPLRIEARQIGGVTHLVLSAGPDASDRLALELSRLRHQLIGAGIDLGNLELRDHRSSPDLGSGSSSERGDARRSDRAISGAVPSVGNPRRGGIATGLPTALIGPITGIQVDL